MTGRSIISEIRSTNKLLSGDNIINDRVIYFEIKSTISLLMKRETNLRRLWQSPNVFTQIPCFEMQEAPLSECCEFTSAKKVAKSVQPLPKIAEGIFGLAVQQITNVENSRKFIEMTPMRYANILKLNLPEVNIYYWILNDYLYVSNPDTKAVNVFAFFEDDVPSSLLFPADCDCKKISQNPCTSILDREMKIPGYLVSSVKDLVSKKLLETYFNLGKDKTSNNADDTSK